MVKPVEEPLLIVSRRTSECTRRLGKHDSVIEQLVASHPLRPEDVVYPTNIAVVSVTPSTIGPVRVRKSIDQLLEALPGQRLAGFVTMALFSGYASLFSLQHVIKVSFGIPDDDSTASHNFSFAITTMYVCNLVFRLGHNVLMSPLSPRERAFVGLLSMSLAMLILAVLVIGMEFKTIWLVALAYAFGGIAVGTFETNYSVVLAALGHRTKIIGISGIPFGIFLVIVPGFIAVTAGLPVEFVYWTVFGLLIVGMGILLYGLTFPEIDWLVSSAVENEIPPVDADVDDLEIEEEHFGHPPPKVGIFPAISVGLVFTINMLAVSAFSPGVLLFLYNTPRIELLPGYDWNTVSTGYFFATFSSFGFLADVMSRKRIYSKRPEYHPYRFLPLTIAGLVVILTKIPLIAPLGTLLIFFANGSIYAQSCRWIDSRCGSKLLVFANSIFFFLGDCGSVIGSLLIPFIRDLLAQTSLANLT
jgi:hypothetical protein